MGAITELHAGIGVDVSDFKDFARALRKAAPEVKAGLTLRLRAVGQVVADEAETNVEPFSTTIPAGIKVRVSGASVSVVSTVMPLSGLFEIGSKGRENQDVFSHPVFGNKDVWVTQPKHEFLGPAVADKAEAVEEAGLDALDEAIRAAAGL